MTHRDPCKKWGVLTICCLSLTNYQGYYITAGAPQTGRRRVVERGFLNIATISTCMRDMMYCFAILFITDDRSSVSSLSRLDCWFLCFLFGFGLFFCVLWGLLASLLCVPLLFYPVDMPAAHTCCAWVLLSWAFSLLPLNQSVPRLPRCSLTLLPDLWSNPVLHLSLGQILGLQPQSFPVCLTVPVLVLASLCCK